MSLRHGLTFWVSHRKRSIEEGVQVQMQRFLFVRRIGRRWEVPGQSMVNRCVVLRSVMGLTSDNVNSSTLPAPATPSALTTMVCKCRLPCVDGRLIQCITCVRTFHMTCCANSPASWKCWMCSSPNSAAPNLHSAIPSGTHSAPGSVPSTSMQTGSISGDRDRLKPRHDVSPHTQDRISTHQRIRRTGEPTASSMGLTKGLDLPPKVTSRLLRRASLHNSPVSHQRFHRILRSRVIYPPL